jgi:serine/threonine-protein kinase
MAQPKYEIIERIGAGGMAEVFRASSTSLRGFQKLVAIKRVLPSLTQNDRFVRMFLDEAKIALPLNHTNIVQTFDLGMADETYFIVMEFVEGTNLKDIIESLGEEGQRIGLAEAVFICLEVCKGLAHAHEKVDQEGEPLNIVHRDISPPNILVSLDGEIKITDFGLAKAKSQAEATDPGVVKGKFGYLSPEAAHGEDIDLRTDIFAVGILLWEMLAGERLFLGESDYKTLQKVRKAEIPSLASRNRQVPSRLQQIVAGALAKHPDQRYQTAEELGRDLANFLFEYGQPITCFDLKHYVEAVVGERDRTQKPELGPAAKAVQREINQFVSIDDIGDLDLKLARQEAIGEEVDVPDEAPEGGDFEDPRAWDDVGFNGEEEMEADQGGSPAPKRGGIPEDVDQTSDEWREQDLGDVARATQSFEAIDGPEESDDDRATAAPSEKPAKGNASGDEEGGISTSNLIVLVVALLVALAAIGGVYVALAG